jgi:T-complex protein 1 subunit zeta
MTSSSSLALRELVPNAEIVSRQDALVVNVSAAVGLARVLRSNLGPTGTYKLLVGGAPGQLTLTKDGLTLLRDMQIQHPTAALVARTATAVDDICGDGTTSTVLLTGALLQNTGSRYVMEENVHPRILTTGLDVARDEVLKFLDTMKIPLEQDATKRREMLRAVARTSLSTKLDPSWIETVCASVNQETIEFPSLILGVCFVFHFYR